MRKSRMALEDEQERGKMREDERLYLDFGIGLRSTEGGSGSRGSRTNPEDEHSSLSPKSKSRGCDRSHGIWRLRVQFLQSEPGIGPAIIVLSGSLFAQGATVTSMRRRSVKDREGKAAWPTTNQ